MSRTFSVTEPHPSVSQAGGYIGGGRGGAGNYRRYKGGDFTQGSNATGPASLASLATSKPPRRTQLGGRGGAGNTFRSSSDSDEAMFKFDEEMSRRSKDAEVAAPVYRVGRGGAGNTFGGGSDSSSMASSRITTTQRSTRMGSTDSSASVSSSDDGNASVRRSLESAFGKLSRKLSVKP